MNPKFEISISRSTRCVDLIDSADLVFEITNAVGVSVTIVGDFLGVYYDGRFLDSKSAINKFVENLHNKSYLAGLLNNSLGRFWLIFKNNEEVVVYASPSSPGAFWTEIHNSIYISGNEFEFYSKTASYDLDGMEVYHHINSKFSQRSPFQSLVSGGHRFLGGQALTITSLSVRVDFYLQSDRYCTNDADRRELLPEFRKIIDNQIKINFDKHRQKRNTVQISGGIDSTLILTSSVKQSLPITAWHYEKSPILTAFVRHLCCDVLGVSVESWPMPAQGTADLDKYFSNMEKLFCQGLGVAGFHHMFLIPQFMKDAPYTMGGISFGAMYQGMPYVSPAFGRGRLRRMMIERKARASRYMFSRKYVENIGAGRKGLESDVFHSSVLPDSRFELLKLLSLTYKGPIKSLARTSDDSFTKKYHKWRVRTTLEPIVGDDLYKELLKGKDIEPQETLRLMRLVRFALNIQSAALNTFTYNRSGLVHLSDPNVDGPLISFFNELDITNYDVMNPKGLLFDYFRDATGKDYYNDLIDSGSIGPVSKREIIGLPAAVMRHIKPHRATKADPKKNMHANTEFCMQLRNKYLNPNDSIVLERVKDIDIRDTLANWYKNIKDDPGADPVRVNQALNLEMFMRAIAD